MAPHHRVRTRLASLVGGLAMAVLASSTLAAGAASAIEIKPDRDFSGDGRALIRSPGEDFATDVVIDGNTAYVIGNSPKPGNRKGYRIVVAKYGPGGNLDRDFGNDGRKYLDLGRTSQAFSGALAPDGGILIAGWSVRTHRSGVVVAKLRPGGTLANDFARGGVSRIEIDAGVEWPLVESEPDGSIWLAWSSVKNYDYEKHDSNFRVMHLGKGGRVDRSFSGDGVRVFDIRTRDFTYFSDVDSTGRFYLTGLSRNSDRAPALVSVLSISDSGPSLTRTINLWERAGSMPLTVDVDDISGDVLLGLSPFTKAGWGAARLNSDLALDDTYGNDGVARHDCRCTSVSGTQTEQGLVLVGNTKGDSKTVIARFGLAGHWDGNLGNATYNLFPDWEYWVETDTDASGRLILAGMAKGSNSDLAIARMKVNPV